MVPFEVFAARQRDRLAESLSGQRARGSAVPRRPDRPRRPHRDSRPWIGEEDELLRAAAAEEDWAGAALQLGRTLKAVRARAVRIGLLQPVAPPWTPAEDRFLLMRYDSLGSRMCAKHLGRRTQAAVKTRIHTLRAGQREEEAGNA